MSGKKNTSLPKGDGAAGVSSTRGIKHWASNRVTGVTVEATSTVTLRCEQDEDRIYEAEEMAGEMAANMSSDGIDYMDRYIDEFLEDTDVTD